MDCRRAKDLILLDYTDEVLKAGALEDLESHLASCTSCRGLAESVKSVGRLIKSIARQDAPQTVWQGICSEVAGLSVKKRFAGTVSDRVRYALYHLRPAVVATAAIILLVFVLATARLVSYMEYSSALSAREDIFNMVSLNGENGRGEYDIGTLSEAYFL